MTQAMSTWLGLVLVLIAGLLSVVVDLVRQREVASSDVADPAERQRWSSRRGWVRPLTVAAFATAALAAGATLVRFSTYT
jgi:hypothetical protein